MVRSFDNPYPVATENGNDGAENDKGEDGDSDDKASDDCDDDDNK